MRCKLVITSLLTLLLLAPNARAAGARCAELFRDEIAWQAPPEVEGTRAILKYAVDRDFEGGARHLKAKLLELTDSIKQSGLDISGATDFSRIRDAKKSLHFAKKLSELDTQISMFVQEVQKIEKENVRLDNYVHALAALKESIKQSNAYDSRVRELEELVSASIELQSNNLIALDQASKILIADYNEYIRTTGFVSRSDRDIWAKTSVDRIKIKLGVLKHALNEKIKTFTREALAWTIALVSIPALNQYAGNPADFTANWALQTQAYKNGELRAQVEGKLGSQKHLELLQRFSGYVYVDGYDVVRNRPFA